MPQVVKRLYEDRDDILALLNHPDEALMDDIEEMWTLECSPKYYVDCWMNMMQRVFDENDALKGINVKELFEKD